MKIGEVAHRTGVSARMLRHYDALGLVRPSGRTAVGYREYSDEDFRRIFHVESLRSLGLSLKEIGRALDDPGFAPSELVQRLIAQTRERIELQTALLDRLRHVADTGPGEWDDVLGVISLLNELGARSPRARQEAALTAVGDRAAPAAALADAVLREDDLNVAGALRWALAQADGDGARILTAALDADAPEVRRRAAEALAELPADDPLLAALAHADAGIRAIAALELGRRGRAEPTAELIAMVIGGANDVAAAEALGVIAVGSAEPIVGALAEALAAAADYAVRQRLVQALAEIPGDAATRELERHAGDADVRIARTAAYIIGRRRGDVKGR